MFLVAMDLQSIEGRMQIRNAVQNGRIMDAIEKVNDMNPEVLDNDTELFFQLQRQHLIELIREKKYEEALEYARDELAPQAEDNPNFLDELEQVMVLFAIDENKMSGGSLPELLSASQRLKTASELNAAILSSQCQEKDPKLPNLLKMLIWAQHQLDEKAVYPRMHDLVSAKLEDKDGGSEGGSESRGRGH